MKLKTLIQTLITSPAYRFIRAISKAKSILLEASKQNQQKLIFYPRKASKKQKKIFFGSFRLHYNWCSSHVVPEPAPALEDLYYDSTWNSVFSNDNPNCCDQSDDGAMNAEDHQSEFSGYLEWLEDQKGCDNYDDKNRNDYDKFKDDIDSLADMFIASCHEKFMLEKVESYRRFQEMLARGL